MLEDVCGSALCTDTEQESPKRRLNSSLVVTIIADGSLGSLTDGAVSTVQ